MNFRAGLHEYFFIPSLVNQTVVILQKIAKILYSSYGSLLVLGILFDIIFDYADQRFSLSFTWGILYEYKYEGIIATLGFAF